MNQTRRPLNERQARFVDAFLADCAGNATKAAIAAGAGRAGARVAGHRLLTLANVQRAIAARVQRREQAAIATADERDRILSTIARDENADASDRIRAICELNKCTGRHSVHLLHQGRLTLEQPS